MSIRLQQMAAYFLDQPPSTPDPNLMNNIFENLARYKKKTSGAQLKSNSSNRGPTTQVLEFDPYEFR